MSLKKLLSVGQSFVGIRDNKSPFEMRKECLLPIFEPGHRPPARAEAPREPSAGSIPRQTDWLELKPEAPSKELKNPGSVQPALMKSPAPILPAAPRRSFWSMVTFGLFDGKPARRPLGAALVQSELSLDRVRVIRNDLLDSDLELVLKKRPQARKASAAASSPSPAPEEGQMTRSMPGRQMETERR